MGCGTSTLVYSDNAAIQAKVRPIIRRRIDDIKRRRDLHKGSTPSKKELLARDDCEKMSSVNNDSLGSKRKAIPSEDSVDLKPLNSKIVPLLEKDEEEEHEASTIVEKLKEEEENHAKDKKEHDTEETEQENRGRGNEAELELEELHEEDDGRCISPGSPSFRFYCVEAIPHDTDDDQECHTESSKKHVEKITPIEEHLASPESSAEAELHQMDSEKRNSPKRKRNRKFRSVIRKGGNVKSMLKVKSCYNPPCTGTHHGHDKAHLLQEAVAA